MSEVRKVLPTMLALARERTEASRVHLAGMLADVFLNGPEGLGLREEEMVNELIDQLMRDSSPAVRAHLINKFADLSRMPRRIAANLAEEEIDIARPVLVAANSLEDEDLIRVVENKGRDHALVVASRAEISEAVADALVMTGDVRVMQAVAENLGAHLSQLAVDVVAIAARYRVPLRDPILHRSEMNLEAALRLYWWVEQDLRRYILKRFSLSSGQIDEALASTISGFLEDHRHQKSDDEVMAQVADWMNDHQAVTPQILPQVLRMGHYRLFNLLLARMAKLNVSLVDMIVGGTGGRGLVALCRAIGVDKPCFVSLFLLSRGGRPGDQIVHPRELSYALALFDRTTPAIAKDLLHSWDVNPQYFSKHVEEAFQEERSYF